MMITVRSLAATVAVALVAALSACEQNAATSPPTVSAANVQSTAGPETMKPPPTESAADVKEAVDIATDAYIYGYSLVTTEVTRMQMSNVDKVDGLRGPMGAFVHAKDYPPTDYRGVSAPNADTLYSVAWLDLSEPQVFTHPEIKNRFFTFELVDMWMHVEDSVGANTTGSKAMKYLFTGPGWSGDVPKGMTHIAFPTRYMVILGRTYAFGTKQDLAKVHALQAKYEVMPLSAVGKHYTFKAPPVNPNPGFSMTEKPQTAILALGCTGYFDLMTNLMGSVAPPAAEDAPMLARMAKIGIVPGQAFDKNKLDPAVQNALMDVPKTALERIISHFDQLGKNENGWRVMLTGGRYGTNYLDRAAWAAMGWPSQLPSVSIYPTAVEDGSNQKLVGTNKYTVTFQKGHMPPVNRKGFWSLTMYTMDNGLWFYPNALNKRTVSPRDKLKYNADGSLTLYVQHDAPGKAEEANWLPAPAGPFAVTMRLYWPNTKSPSIVDGTWQPPPLVRAP
jgi:hypothetical protein